MPRRYHSRPGDEAASRDRFEALVQPLLADLWWYAYRALGNVDDADDALQNLLLRVWGRFESFRGDSSERSWLMVILRNLITDGYRWRARHPTVSLDARQDNASYESEIAAAGRDRQAELDDVVVQQIDLEQTLATLEPDVRNAVYLIYIVGLPYREAAVAMRVSPTTVKRLCDKGRAVLRAAIENPAEPAP